MAEKISDNVGKKIVEALKMQNKGLEQEPISIEEEEMATTPIAEVENVEEVEEAEPQAHEQKSDIDSSYANEQYTQSELPYVDLETFAKQGFHKSEIDTAFQNSINQNLNLNTFSNFDADVEYPNNVAILNHLISKLPAGVTKQTGALIIRQTMEALGIPMKSVIQEAQQVQDNLSMRARECQKNIVDYRKQIATLEIKSQQYQKQAIAMHDIINLFKSTGA